MQISELDCEGSPELVVITNTGTEPQNLSGWKLESDPPAQESLDLTPLGTILPSQSILVESGPAAAAAFTWSSQNVFRDKDATDYVRIVDAAGAIVQQVACATAATPTPTPSTPTATPTPLTGIVPDGGGPPAASIDLPSATVVAVFGGSLAAAGLIILISPLLAALFASRRRSRAVSATDTLIIPAPAVVIQSSKRRQRSIRPYLFAGVAGLSIVALTVLLLQPGDRR